MEDLKDLDPEDMSTLAFALSIGALVFASILVVLLAVA